MGDSFVSDQPLPSPILTGFFRLNPVEMTKADRAKVDEIDAYLAGEESDIDKIAKLKDIRFRLGSPRIGTKEIDHVLRYIKIRKSIQQKEAEAMAMEQ